jgi:Tol biopolymer transport system component
MTASDRFDMLIADLPDVLVDIAAPRTPDYTDELLERATAPRQRPRWTFPRRWLPAALADRRFPAALAGTWRTVAVALVILALIAAAIAVVGSHRRLPPPFGLARPGAIAYVAGGDIWLADAGGRNEAAMTSTERVELRPLYSPDGTKLAFNRLSEAGARSDWQEWADLVVADADASHETVLDANAQGLSPATWSADGTFLVYSHLMGGHDQIFVARLDGTSPTMLTSGPATNWAPVLAPDDRRIAFYRSTAAGTQLSLIDVDGGDEHVVSERSIGVNDVGVWSPDGKSFLYAAGDTANSQRDLWIVDVAAQTERRLVAGEGSDIGPDWSPDGGRIAYLDETDGSTVRVMVVDVHGGVPRAISDVSVWSYPRWSPDGKTVVITDEGAAGTTPAVVLLDPDGTAPATRIELPDVQGPARGDQPAWQRLAP